MGSNNKYILFEDSVKVNRSAFNVVVNIICDDKGLLHFCARIDGVKDIELNINENGIWYDVNTGVTDISEAIGNLIEQKTL